jgi:hypothetical protein
MDSGDKHLIFLISQPRSGSTLLQHMLASHSEVYTLPEPWFMLHLVYGLRSSGIEAEYNAQYAYLALKDFLERIRHGKTTYLEAIRSMALYLYRRALEPSGKKYFLDKTPRYYLIIPELRSIFPNAAFIFLLRNPLAVLSSILEVNLGGNWAGLIAVDRRHDILSAPRLILNGIKQLGERAAVVYYERLVTDPEQTVKELCYRIGLEFEPSMLNYGGKVKFEGTTFVDPNSIYKHQGPVVDYLEKWSTCFDSPQKIYIAKSYLASLGRNTVDRLGYSYDDLEIKLKSLKSDRKLFIIPWRLFITSSKEPPYWYRLMLAFVSSLQNRGIRETLRRCANFVLKRG